MQANTATLLRLSNGEVRFARGWFIIGGIEEFPIDSVTPVKYFNQDLVVFRGTPTNGNESEVVIMDAYCPHLGAHLGYGGKVVGNTIQCPFHAWRFDATGQCVEIPYAKKIPAKACTKTWTTMIRSGVVFIWHDPEGNSPYYDIPEMPEFGFEGWTNWNLQRMEIKTQPREIIENVSDKAHFVSVHKMHEVLSFENTFDGHIATQEMAGTVPGGSVYSKATYYGPAFQYTWLRSAVESRLINANTPIDENRVHLWFGMMMKISDFTEDEAIHIKQAIAEAGYAGDFDLNSDILSMIHDMVLQATQQGYHDDVAIWETKLFRPNPVLCDGDGPLAKLRKWYNQFYEDVKP